MEQGEGDAEEDHWGVIVDVCELEGKSVFIYRGLSFSLKAESIESRA